MAARETHVDVPTEIQRAATLDGVEHCPFAEGERMDGLVSWTVSSNDVRQLQPRLVALRRPPMGQRRSVPDLLRSQRRWVQHGCRWHPKEREVYRDGAVLTGRAVSATLCDTGPRGAAPSACVAPAFRARRSDRSGKSRSGFHVMMSRGARSAAHTEEHLDAELSAERLSASDFHEVDFRAPLDVELYLSGAPAAATAKGMFFEQLALSARKSGVACEVRYLAFRDYPLRDLMLLMLAYGRARYPGSPTREALRRVGWEAFPALMSSVAGRVIFAFAGNDVKAALRLAPAAYKQSLSHGVVRTRLSSARQVVLEFRDIWNFADCYQIGAIEGGCRAFGAQPRVRAHRHSPSSLDMLVRW